jgi:hypothetical protein
VLQLQENRNDGLFRAFDAAGAQVIEMIEEFATPRGLKRTRMYRHYGDRAFDARKFISVRNDPGFCKPYGG